MTRGCSILNNETHVVCLDALLSHLFRNSQGTDPIDNPTGLLGFGLGAAALLFYCSINSAESSEMKPHQNLSRVKAIFVESTYNRRRQNDAKRERHGTDVKIDFLTSSDYTDLFLSSFRVHTSEQ